MYKIKITELWDVGSEYGSVKEILYLAMDFELNEKTFGCDSKTLGGLEG